MTNEQRKNKVREFQNSKRQRRKLLKEFIERFDLAPINVTEENKLNDYLNVKLK